MGEKKLPTNSDQNFNREIKHVAEKKWCKTVLYSLILLLIIGFVFRLFLKIDFIFQIGFTASYISPLIFVFLGKDWMETYTYCFLSSLLVPAFTAFLPLMISFLAYTKVGDFDSFLQRIPQSFSIFLLTWLTIAISFSGFLLVAVTIRWAYQKIR